QLDGGSVQGTMSRALGLVGTRIASAYARFGALTSETMQRYCLSRLPALLESKNLGRVRVDLDPSAMALVGAALATPLMPLDELAPRLAALIPEHVEAADDGNNHTPASVELTAAADPELAASIIANLTSPVPDITLATKLLRVDRIINDPDAVVDVPPAVVDD